MPRSIALLLATALALAGCGRGEEPAAIATGGSDATGPVTVTAAVPVADPAASSPPGPDVTVARADQTTTTAPVTSPSTAASASSSATRQTLTVERAGRNGRRGNPAGGEVLLWVSNQSVEDDTVDVTVTIDGQPVVADELKVENQHNWIGYYVTGLTPGEHQVAARSGTGADFAGSFTLPEGEPRWLVVDYWFDPDNAEGRHFTFTESDHAVMFL